MQGFKILILKKLEKSLRGYNMEDIKITTVRVEYLEKGIRHTTERGFAFSTYADAFIISELKRLKKIGATYIISVDGRVVHCTNLWIAFKRWLWRLINGY